MRLLYKIHLWVGLVCAVIFFGFAVTGAVIVFEPELRAAVYPTIDTRAIDTRAPLALDRVIGDVAARFTGMRIDRVTLPAQPGEPLSFRMYRSENFTEPFFVLADPYSGRVLKSGGFLSFPIEMCMWLHASLLLGEIGEAIVGIFGAVLILVCVIGVILWWPGLYKMRAALRVAWRSRRDRMLLDLHKATGALSVLFVVFLALTGSLVVLAAYLPLHSLPAAVSSYRAAGSSHSDVPFMEHSVDAAISAAHRLFPEARVYAVYFSARDARNLPYRIGLKRDSFRNPVATDDVWIEPRTGAVLAQARYADQPAVTRGYNWIFPLHTGEAFGLWARIIVFVSGLMLAVLSVVGTWLWLERERIRRRRAQAAPATSAPAG